MRHSIQQRGFTLTELVLILVLVGILAAFAAPRLNIEGFERQSFARELTIALRHAQRVAIASGCAVDVTIQASGFSVAWAAGGDCGSGTLPHPTRGGAFTGSGQIGTGIGTVRFDGMGRTAGGTAIVVTDGPTILVEAGSGYVREA
ncbi:MAG: prepilin-type N-terminal cleavage/methylation domain-containing protein [Wenzhouxiangella sp.]|nr:MAG: prepilin-type N-terminal cleavage/methylation domain-containing protein [Wenzhouxiangella sp.]